MNNRIEQGANQNKDVDELIDKMADKITQLIMGIDEYTAVMQEFVAISDCRNIDEWNMTATYLLKRDRELREKVETMLSQIVEKGDSITHQTWVDALKDTRNLPKYYEGDSPDQSWLESEKYSEPLKESARYIKADSLDELAAASGYFNVRDKHFYRLSRQVSIATMQLKSEGAYKCGSEALQSLDDLETDFDKSEYVTEVN